MFEKASRLKLTFSTAKGTLSADYLWDLPLTQLDSIAKDINKRIKAAEEESFIAPKSAANTLDVLRLDIVKHIINVRQSEAKEKLIKNEINAQTAVLEAALARKKEEELSNLSIEDLQKRIKDLQEASDSRKLF